jgi:hypothetical protein
MGRCAKEIYKRDTYRRTGRGKTGFEMHYNRTQCSRRAMPDSVLCWQHGDSARSADAVAGTVDEPQVKPSRTRI